MAYEVWRGTRKHHETVETLQEARALVEEDLPHSPVLALSPFGGTAAIRWVWDLDNLEARNAENGMVAYTIRRVPEAGP